MDPAYFHFSISGCHHLLFIEEVRDMKKYLIMSTVLSGLLMVVYGMGKEGWVPLALHAQFPTLVFFFFLQSLFVSWLLYQGEKTHWKSPVYALGAITFRFLTALFFLLLLFSMKPDNMRPLMIQFVVLYLAYLIFELFAVLPNLRRN